MQLAVDVQIPAEFGGSGGEAIYIGMAASRVTSLTIGQIQKEVWYLKDVRKLRKLLWHMCSL